MQHTLNTRATTIAIAVAFAMALPLALSSCGGGSSGNDNSGGTGGGGGTGGSGGAGGEVPECSKPSDCRLPNTDCFEQTCVDGKCGTKAVPAGTVLSEQTKGDCRRMECNEVGYKVSVVDDTDIPDSIGSCQVATCENGTPKQLNAELGTSCGVRRICDRGGQCILSKSIAAGGGHTCAVTEAGVVWCWGRNSNGQLGDGTTDNKLVPTQVSGPETGVVAVSAGGSHTCAVTEAGELWCWGSNQFGQLGDGTTMGKYVPTEVTGFGASVVAVSAGSDHTCAVTEAGQLWCWGKNDYSKLGEGTTTNRYVPTQVSGLETGVVAVSAGWYHTCAVTEAGLLWCWGWNEYGQLGEGTTSSRYLPAQVTDLAGVVAVSAGAVHTCAVTEAGLLWCWGWNEYGQNGDGTTEDMHVPTQVTGFETGVAAVSAWSVHTCAVTEVGGLWCWGGNAYGGLGEGTTEDKYVPTQVTGLATSVVAVSAGDAYTCAVTEAGGLRCWGYNARGELGNNTTNNGNVPTGVTGFP